MNEKPGKKLTALITGGSRGIGRSISLRLASTCAKTVIVNYLENDVEAQKTKLSIEHQQTCCVLVRSNLLYPDEIDKLFEQVKSCTSTVDIFIHCAALNAFKPLLEIKPNQWDMTMNINARAFLLCVQQVVPLMKTGKIVAISSLGSQRAVPNYGALGPTKAALESMVRYLAVELAPLGIQVNAVTAGFVDTDSLKRFPDADRLKAESSTRTPARRLGLPDDIADVVMFLVSPSSRWICGQTIVADGGVSIV